MKTLNFSSQRLLVGLLIACLFVSCKKEEFPQAEFTFFVPNNCQAPCGVKFFNNSQKAERYLWRFGDGQISEEKEPEHLYQTAGLFEVELEAFNEHGSASTKQVIILSGSGPGNGQGQNPDPTGPSASFTVNNEGCEAPCTVTFTNTSVNATSYSWTFGDGNNSNQASPSHTYTSPGIYQVSLIAIGNGQSPPFTRNLRIGSSTSDEPEACFDVSNDGCAASCSVSFNNCSEGAVSFRWDFGDGGTSTQANPSHTYTEAGSYEVQLTAINAVGETDEVSEYVEIEEGAPAYSEAYITKVELYGAPLFANSGLWDLFDGPDVYYGWYDGSSYGSPSTVFFNASSTPLIWNGGSNDPAPSNKTLYIHFYDYDAPYADQYMGRSSGLRIQNYIDDEEFPSVVDLSYPTDEIYVRVYLEWE